MKDENLRCPNCDGGNLDCKGGLDKDGFYFDNVNCRDCAYSVKGVRLDIWDMIRGNDGMA